MSRLSSALQGASNQAGLPRQHGLNTRILARAWSHVGMRIAVSILVLLVLMIIFAPAFLEVSATRIDVSARYIPPVFVQGGQLPHIFGTDQLGRDVFLRSLIGLRNALVIGIASVIGMFFLGSVIGILAGFHSGWIDVVLMRLTDIQMSIPVIIMGIIILGSFRPTMSLITLVLILCGWPLYARVVRSVAIAEVGKEYVRAARILGGSNTRIMARHIAPSILPPISFIAVLDVARMMIFAGIFGFLGIGIQPPTPALGTIIANGTQFLLSAWWITVMPGAMFAITLCCFNLIGGFLERSRNQILRGE